MKKQELKSLIKEKVVEFNNEQDPHKKRDLSIRLEKLVQTYLEMSSNKTMNRMIRTNGK